MNYLTKTDVFLLLVIICVPPNNHRQSSFNINAVVLILIICKDFTKLVKCIPESMNLCMSSFIYIIEKKIWFKNEQI